MIYLHHPIHLPPPTPYRQISPPQLHVHRHPEEGHYPIATYHQYTTPYYYPFASLRQPLSVTSNVTTNEQVVRYTILGALDHYNHITDTQYHPYRHFPTTIPVYYQPEDHITASIHISRDNTPSQTTNISRNMDYRPTVIVHCGIQRIFSW